jgi:hypothetical protein
MPNTLGSDDAAHRQWAGALQRAGAHNAAGDLPFTRSLVRAADLDGLRRTRAVSIGAALAGVEAASLSTLFERLSAEAAHARREAALQHEKRVDLPAYFLHLARQLHAECLRDWVQAVQAQRSMRAVAAQADDHARFVALLDFRADQLALAEACRDQADADALGSLEALHRLDRLLLALERQGLLRAYDAAAESLQALPSPAAARGSPAVLAGWQQHASVMQMAAFVRQAYVPPAAVGFRVPELSLDDLPTLQEEVEALAACSAARDTLCASLPLLQKIMEMASAMRRDHAGGQRPLPRPDAMALEACVRTHQQLSRLAARYGDAYGPALPGLARGQAVADAGVPEMPAEAHAVLEEMGEAVFAVDEALAGAQSHLALLKHCFAQPDALQGRTRALLPLVLQLAGQLHCRFDEIDLADTRFELSPAVRFARHVAGYTALVPGSAEDKRSAAVRNALHLGAELRFHVLRVAPPVPQPAR